MEEHTLGMQENSIEITLIVPCYNVEEKFISCAVKSINAQAYRNFEVIIVDDGSDDKHHVILEEIASKQKNITLISTEHVGVSKARNTAVLRAKGKYVAFMDSDDLLEPTFLETALYMAEKEKADFVIGGMRRFQRVKLCNTKGINHSRESYDVFDGEQVRELMQYFIGSKSLIRFPGGYVGRGPVARLIRRDVLQNVLFPANVKMGEDLIWNLKMLSVCRRVVIVRQVWYWYRINPNSVTHAYTPDVYDCQMEQFNEIDKYIDANGTYFMQYIERVYEGIYIIYDCFLKYRPVGSRRVIDKLYSEKPWILFGDPRIVLHSKSKLIRCYSALYRLHLLFLSLKVKGGIFSMKSAYLRTKSTLCAMLENVLTKRGG